MPRTPHASVFRTLLITILLLLGIRAAPAGAQTLLQPPAGAADKNPVRVETAYYALPAAGTPGRGHFPAGASGLLVVTLTPEKDWYFYANDPGPLGQPTRIAAATAAGPLPFATLYPEGRGKPDPFGSGQTVRVHEKATRFFIPLPAGMTEPVRLTISMLMCSHTRCLPLSFTQSVAPSPARPEPATAQPWWKDALSAKPGTAPASGTTSLEGTTGPVPVGATPGAGGAKLGPTPYSPRFIEPVMEVTGLFKAALLAFLAGLVLNLMPCVLPVASLKLKGLLSGCTRESHPNPVRCFRTFNLYFALGVITYFLFLAGLLASLDLAWGQIFQNPRTVLALVVIVFALSLSLFGVFTLPIVDLKAPAGGGPQSRASSFFAGCLATLLATPCSGPFLGGVLAWTLMQPTQVVAVVFACIGLGMASPYLLMCARPHMLFIFNLPGRWTLFVEKLAGFFLAGTAVYLLGTLPAWSLERAVILLLITAFAAWMWGSWTSLSHPLRHRISVRLAAVALVAAAWVWAAHPPVPDAGWQRYEPAAFEQMLGKEPMLVDFTADWCPNCKFLELTVLTEENMARWKRLYGLRFVKVDLTRSDPAAEALLEAMDSRSIPVVALFPASGQARSPLVLRDLFTSATLEKALEKEFARRPETTEAPAKMHSGVQPGTQPAAQ